LQLLDRLNLRLGRSMAPVLQTEASECGLACVVMLLAYHGTATDLQTLRRRHGTTPRGMSLVDLSRVAAAEQLVTRPVRVELGEMPQLRLPCVLHWDLSHFVVLTAVSGSRFEIVDPAFGARSLGPDEMSRHFSGVAVEAWPDSAFVPRTETQSISLRQLVGRVSNLWPTVGRVLAISLGLEALALVTPLFMQWIVDHVIVSRDSELLTTLGIGFLLLLMFQQVLSVLRSWLLLRVSTQLRVQWRSNVLNHLLNLPLDYFARRHLGDVMSRFGSIGKIQDVLTNTFVEVALDGVMVTLALVLMFLYSPKLAAVAIVAVALYVLVRLIWYAPLRAAVAERIVRSANESSHLLETVRGVRTIRLFARHYERLSAWQTLMVADVNASLRIQKLEIMYRLVRRTLSGVFSLGLLWMGAREVIAGNLSVGALLAFLAYRGQFDSRFTELVNKWFDLRMVGLDAQRLADIVLTPTEEQSHGQTRPAVDDAAASIVIEDLSFRYAEGASDVLTQLNLRVEAGESVAITGASGCGKSTLVALLLGVHKPQRGVIRVDGVPLERYGLEAWRGCVGTVLQDDVLFAGTIADNIAFFDPNLSMEQVTRCARLAAVHDDIMRLPMAYQSLIGDMGSTLSGGQKQRVLLARALYRQPRVLILDEATSHLDLDREAQVGRAIASMPVTRILIAHRPHTLITVDRVVEIDAGRIVRDETRDDYASRMGLSLLKPSAPGPSRVASLGRSAQPPADSASN
jgi:ATP-binding cassette, subfamily B, bacterial CvaB/MchF/RaxB